MRFVSRFKCFIRFHFWVSKYFVPHFYSLVLNASLKFRKVIITLLKPLCSESDPILSPNSARNFSESSSKLSEKFQP